MNPLDPLEIKSFEDKLKEMPIHNESGVRIPYTLTQFPKNLNNESVRVNNRFLNKHEHIIEEIYNRDKNHILPNWFREYQRKYYLSSEILNHDGFFHKNQHLEYRNASYQGMVLGFGSKVPSVGGGGSPDLVTEVQNTSGNNLASYIYGQHLSDGVVGNKYNQAAFHRALSSGALGQLRYGVYDQQAGIPTNLMADTGLFNTDADNTFLWHGFTEFALTTVTNYSAILGDATGTANPLWYFRNPATGNNAYRLAAGVTTFYNPAAFSVTTYTLVLPEAKVGHT